MRHLSESIFYETIVGTILSDCLAVIGKLLMTTGANGTVIRLSVFAPPFVPALVGAEFSRRGISFFLQYTTAVAATVFEMLGFIR
jgi:hypothetical protein